jgi:hypothetical protein
MEVVQAPSCAELKLLKQQWLGDAQVAPGLPSV